MAKKKTPPPEGTVTDLTAAIKALREELSKAMTASTDEDLRFEVGTVTMEFAVEVTADKEGHAGIKFWVVDVGGGGGRSRSATHTVTLELTPHTSAGGNVEISDDD
jgi:Trypsin-co-occurring domain 2